MVRTDGGEVGRTDGWMPFKRDVHGQCLVEGRGGTGRSDRERPSVGWVSKARSLSKQHTAWATGFLYGQVCGRGC